MINKHSRSVAASGPIRWRLTSAPAAAAFALTVAVAFGGCGGDDSSDSSTATEVSAAASTTSEAPAASSTTSDVSSTVTIAETTTTMPSPEVTDVKIFTPATSSAWGWLYVGEAKGIFEKYGLNVSHESIQTSAELPALINGDFQATVSVGNAERAALQGQPVVSLMSNLTGGTFGLAVSADIQTPEDLRGKSIVTANRASGIYVVISQWLQANGLVDDVELVSLDTPGSQETAFIAGQFAGLFSSYDRVVTAADQFEGGHILLDPTDFSVAAGAQAGISVSSEFLAANPNTVQALLAGVFESTKLVLEDREGTAEIWAAAFGMTSEQALKVYDGVIGRIALRAVPSEEDYAYNAQQDSAGVQRTVTVDEVKAVWDTSIAEDVYAALDCPDVCSG